VAGDHAAGTATVEAVNVRGRTAVTLLALDLPSQELLLLIGSEEKLHSARSLRGFLQTERARFVSQDHETTEAEELQEQASLPPEDHEVVSSDGSTRRS
jgi:hypothetical protein